MNSCPKEKPPGSPRTFSTLPPNLQPSRQARPPLSLSFLHSAPFFLFVPIESKAKQKWFVCLLYLLDERERALFRFRVYGLDRFGQRNERGARSERMLLRSGSSREENKMLLPLPRSFLALLIFPSNAGQAAAGAGGRNLREERLLLGPFFFQCNTGKRPLFVIPAAFQILY